MHILISLIALLFIFGCAEKTVYVSVPSAANCIVPAKPDYPQLNEAQHIAEPENIESLMLIISDMSAYIKQLRSAITCLKGERGTGSADAVRSENERSSVRVCGENFYGGEIFAVKTDVKTSPKTKADSGNDKSLAKNLSFVFTQRPSAQNRDKKGVQP